MDQFEVNGSKLVVGRATSKRQYVPPFAGHSHTSNWNQQSEPQPNLFVKNLQPSVDENVLADAFLPYGHVKFAKVQS